MMDDTTTLYIMKLILSILTERLHRYVFDTYYVQNYSITRLDNIVIILYRFMSSKLFNWRHDIKEYSKTLIRYDTFDRN